MDRTYILQMEIIPEENCWSINVARKHWKGGSEKKVAEGTVILGPNNDKLMALNRKLKIGIVAIAVQTDKTTARMLILATQLALKAFVSFESSIFRQWFEFSPNDSKRY